MTNQTDNLRVLLIYRRMIPSVRLCGHCQLEYLHRLGRLEYRCVQTEKLCDSVLNWADVVVLGRLDSWQEYRLAKALSERNKYLLYILDDDLLNIPEGISSNSYYTPRRQEYVRKMIGLSNGILSPSPRLLEKYAVPGQKRFRVVEPAIDPAQFRPHEPGSPVKIGFAGSLDRAGDVEEILKETLLRIHQTYGEAVRFSFFGPCPSFAQAIGAEHIPYSDSYEDYRRTLNRLSWDIGLAPMPDSPFHACKHYNKFSEYAAAGIAGIFSDVPPYTRLREEFGLGVFCENTSEGWYSAISRLIENEQEREQIRRDSLACAAGPFSVASAALDFWEQMQTITLPTRSTGRNHYFIRLYGVLDYGASAAYYLRRNGIRKTLQRLSSAQRS